MVIAVLDYDFTLQNIYIPALGACENGFQSARFGKRSLCKQTCSY